MTIPVSGLPPAASLLGTYLFPIVDLNAPIPDATQKATLNQLAALYLSLATGGTVAGNLAVTGTLHTTGLATLSGGISTVGIAASGTLQATGLATLSGGVSTTNITASGTLQATGLATLSGGASVTGNVVASGVVNPGVHIVSALPSVTSANKGEMAFASDARNTGEGGGGGTGCVVVVNNAGTWISVWSGVAPTT